MTNTTGRRAFAWISAAGLALALAACDGDDAPKDDTPAAQPQESAEPDGAGTEPDEAGTETAASDDDGNEGRAFDSTDDAVITAIEAALSGQNATARWEGSTIVIEVDGSIDDPTAGLHCSAAHAVIADDEKAVMAYADGDFDCEERR